MDKEQTAFERLRQGELLSHRYYDGRPLQICYSGGKDSDVLVELAVRSGIDFEVVHSHTTADAPETVRYVRQRFKELEEKGVKCSIIYPTYKGEPTSMWKLIPQKKMPPTRIVRYCCEVLKETSGKNRAIATGVRWGESVNRANSRGTFEANHAQKEKRIILLDDNTEDRRFVERCEMKSSVTVNPIVEWIESDVWDYLAECKCESNPLYKCGFKRVGCIGCPIAGKHRWQEFEMFPKFKNLYVNAFQKIVENMDAETKKRRCSWQNGHDVFLWWMEENPDQMAFEGFNGR